MKRLCLLLIFINVVYFFWGLSQPASSPDSLVLDTQGLERLTEVSVEKPLPMSVTEGPELEPEKAVFNAVIKQPTLIDSCYLVGGFGSEHAAVQFVTVLQDKNLRAAVQQRLVAEEFWVIQPAANNGFGAMKNVAKIKAKGVSDLWLVPNGVDKGVISLGLFATKGRADKRLEELAGKKIKAVIRVRQKFNYDVRFGLVGDIADARTLLMTVSMKKSKNINKIAC